MRVAGLVILATGCAAGQPGSNFHVRELELPVVVLVLEGRVTAAANPIDRRWLASPPIRKKDISTKLIVPIRLERRK